MTAQRVSRPAPAGLARLNALPAGEAESALLACCGSREWARRLAAERPFADVAALYTAADRVWGALGRADWLEAFRAHPRIGERSAADPAAAGAKAAASRGWSQAEQAGTRAAGDTTRAALAEANRDYEARFGHIFIVCATGKSAEEMRALARQRLQNDPATELGIAAEEQRKITRLRLEKLVGAEQARSPSITTHVLDTARGRPARGVAVMLEVVRGPNDAEVLARGATDQDGRLRELLPAGHALVPGTYRLTFDTGAYFAAQHAPTFYPEVAIVFAVRDAGEHYHVPLLLSPFGYSTYRGS